MIRCYKCKKSKSVSAFHKCNSSKYKSLRSKYQAVCKQCKHEDYLQNRKKVILRSKKFRQDHPRITKSRRQTYYQNHKEEIKQKVRDYGQKPGIKERNKLAVEKYHKKHGRRLKKNAKWTSIKRKYGLTQQQYIELYNKQRGKCAICGCKPKTLHVDHCHKTDKVRGLLCGSCNRAIGLLKDKSEVCLSASRYLKNR